MDFLKGDNKIYLEDSKGKIIAEVEYEEIKQGVYNIKRTYVDKSLRGQGVASKLVEEAVKEIKKKNCKITATCSYANAWLKINNN